MSLLAVILAVVDNKSLLCSRLRAKYSAFSRSMVQWRVRLRDWHYSEEEKQQQRELISSLCMRRVEMKMAKQDVFTTAGQIA